jgi:hypothetical protein
MATLTGNSVASTYKSLLKTVDNDVVGSSLKTVTDGFGNATALSLDDNSVVVSGEFITTGSVAVSGSISSNNTVVSPIFMTPQTITDSVDIPSDYNAFLVGPVSFTGTVTVGTGSNLTIL